MRGRGAGERAVPVQLIEGLTLGAGQMVYRRGSPEGRILTSADM